MADPIRAGAYRVGDDVKALDIMPTRFKSSNALADGELAKAAFADLDPAFAGKAVAGEYGIVVAGQNFGGGGKTIEGPVFALRGAGVKLVIADGFARYFLCNAINDGPKEETNERGDVAGEPGVLVGAGCGCADAGVEGARRGVRGLQRHARRAQRRRRGDGRRCQGGVVQGQRREHHGADPRMGAKAATR